MSPHELLIFDADKGVVVSKLRDLRADSFMDIVQAHSRLRGNQYLISGAQVRDFLLDAADAKPNEVVGFVPEDPDCFKLLGAHPECAAAEVCRAPGTRAVFSYPLTVVRDSFARCTEHVTE